MPFADHSLQLFVFQKKMLQGDKHRDKGPNYWPTWCQFWLFGSNTGRRIQDSHYFVPYHISQTASPTYMIPSDSPKWGTVLEMLASGVLLSPIFLFPPSSCLHIFISHQWRGSQDFGNNTKKLQNSKYNVILPCHWQYWFHIEYWI